MFTPHPRGTVVLTREGVPRIARNFCGASLDEAEEGDVHWYDVYCYPHGEPGLEYVLFLDLLPCGPGHVCCAHCLLPRKDHADEGKCLYAPDYFEALIVELP